MSLFKKKNYKDVEPKDAFTILEKHRGDPNYIPLDVRTPQEYGEGHIENSQLLDVNSPHFEEDVKKMDKDKIYYIYCRSGVRSKKAAKIMGKQGFKDIYNIIGGFEKWKGKRLPFEN